MEEGDDCLEETCDGIFTCEPVGCTCSTHPHPPCGACENGGLTCDTCGCHWNDE